MDRAVPKLMSGGPALDLELRAFENSRAGKLEDVGGLRRDVAEAIASAKTRSVPRSVEIFDRRTEHGLTLRFYRPHPVAPAQRP